MDAGSIPLRTGVFEPLAIASLAWLIGSARESGAAPVARWVLALALVVFGVDYFLALGFIASLVPAWIPLHAFWVALFGAAFIAAGLAFAFEIQTAMGFARDGADVRRAVLGATRDPAEWSSRVVEPTDRARAMRRFLALSDA